MRYVGRIGARQSSAGSVTYVSADCGTGLLRTCNILRIAGVPVLRNDGGGGFADTLVWTWVASAHCVQNDSKAPVTGALLLAAN
ncbi:MAG: hypothetical protein LBM98_04655 [Oscillospiraceae bacterium]|nr:hypothetical protein [Oscillospiraceae bacterium]